MEVSLQRRWHLWLARHLPEQRLFLRSDTETRFLRLRPATQAAMLAGGALLILWTLFLTAVFLISTLTSDLRDQAARQQDLYETRLNDMARERDRRLAEARAAQDRFYMALANMSEQQSRLLETEDRNLELAQANEALHRLLREAIRERQATRAEADALRTELRTIAGSARTEVGRARDAEETLDHLVDALARLARERDAKEEEKRELRDRIAELELDARLAEERNARVFARLEEAATISLAPLERMFERAGLSTDKIISDVRRAYSGTGGPLTPVTFSTRGAAEDATTARANELLRELDRINLYRIAVESAPFGYPVRAAHRFTSGFGSRTDPKTGRTRAHNGIDLAGARGTPIYATADGVVTHASWQGGYGRLVTIRHSFGFESRYAHLNAISVRVGQRVSRGDRIGDMGTTGRSTGVHLHYEVHLGGRAVNPMTFIRAARDVF